MSAAASGFAVPYVVIAPTSADLNNIEFGRRLFQSKAMFNNAQPVGSEWYVSGTKTDPVRITPLKARYVNHSKVIPANQLQDNYVLRARVI